MMLYVFLFTAVSALSELSMPLEQPVITEEAQEIEKIIQIVDQEDLSDTNTTEDVKAIETTDATNEAREYVTIINAIQPEMLAYKHWMGTYSPESFTLSINGEQIPAGSEYKLPSDTKMLSIEYTYSFMKNMYSGTRNICYKINENVTQATITFSWNQDPRVIIDNATIIKNT